jgi:2-desacetyl-2-hydroxyethyl bacteriochlorophyllide A dehydrogenase
MAQMTAAFLTGKESIEVRETDVPSPGPGEVLVRVRACGICGTDLHYYHGAFPSLPSVPPGHEYAGEIAELGEGVSGFEAGQRVAVEPLRNCRECVSCRTGNYHLCSKRVLGGAMAPGALAEYVTVPAYGLYPLPDGLDFELGALAEPLAVAVHGLHIVGLGMGERVLVMGSGTIGLLSIIAARAAGAGEVVATYRHEHQGEAALAVGAARIVKADEVGGEKGFDVVIETIGGNAPTLGQALGTVRSGGRISVLGVFTQATEMNALMLILKEVSIVGGITYCRPGRHSDFDVALRILQSDPEQARAVITHRFPLAEAGRAFATAADKSSGSLKVQVQT